MTREYKVTVDQTLSASNDPASLEKKMREMAEAGWILMHVTSVTAGGSDITKTPRIYLFWERSTAAPADAARGDESSFGALVRKQLGGSSKP